MLGENFINVMDDGSPGRDQDPVAFRLLSGLSARLNVLAQSLSPTMSWTLYLSEGGLLDEDVDLPAHLTLVLAPRVSVGLRSATLTIRGVTDLGREPRFDTRRGGRVRLLGPLDEILPVWWFVAEQMGAAAIEAAAHAALDRAGEGLAQVPVVLDRPIRVNRTVVVRWEDATRGGERRELIVRGRHPVGCNLGRASIYSESASSLMRVHGQVAVAFSDVGFSSVVTTTEGPPAPLVELCGDLDGSAFERCTFVSYRQSFLSLTFLPEVAVDDYQRVREILDGRVTPTAAEHRQLRAEVNGDRVGMVRLECCSMQRSARFIAGDGVVVRRGARVLLNVVSTSFVSHAGHVIAASVGMLVVEDCCFDLEPSDDRYLDQKNVVDGEGWSRGGPAGPDARLWSALVVGEVSSSEVVPSMARRPPPVALAAVSLVASHLQVRGLAALAGAPLSPTGTEMQLTLNNVLQSGTHRGEYVIDLRGATVTGTLVMQGCTLSGYARVFEENPGDFRVFDIGTRLPPGASFLTPQRVQRLSRTVPS